MRLYEKILIGLFSLLFILQLFSFPGKSALFLLLVWIIAFSYLVGGFWLLNTKKDRKVILSILAGIAFATSIVTLPYTIRIRQEPILKILPILNGLFFIGLGVYLYVLNRSKKIDKRIKGIFVRSAIILVIVGFFSYTPAASFKPYRTILIALNNGIDHLVCNMKMINCYEASKDAMESGACDMAIELAEEANSYGKCWLGMSSFEMDSSKVITDALKEKAQDEFIKRDNLWLISATYSNLYKAYKCKANTKYEEKNYKEALQYYLKANKALNSCDHRSETWEIEKSYSLNLIAICYKSLKNYDAADSLFSEAIEKYQSIRDTADKNVAIFYRNFGESLSEQFHYEYANILFEGAIYILEKGRDSEEERVDLIELYNKLIKNHILTDSLEQALYFINEAFKVENENDVEFCKTKLYEGVCLFAQDQYTQADKIFKQSLECCSNKLEKNNQSIAENYLALAKTNISLAKYSSANDYLDKGIEITTNNFGTNSVRYANYLKVMAHLDKELGNYRLAENKYLKVLKIYKRGLGERNVKLHEVLSNLADVEITLAKYDIAKQYSDSSLSIASIFIDLNSRSNTYLLNNAAYVNYYVGNLKKSDSLYRKSIQINTEYGLINSSAIANSQNGRALIMTEKKKFEMADSLFNLSLKIYKQIFEEYHPSIATVYLNKGLLRIEENKLSEAKQMLNRSLEINQRFFDEEHDVFADIYVALADISKKEKEPKVAKEYYQKALDIYLEKFDKEHTKVIIVKKKITDE